MAHMEMHSLETDLMCSLMLNHRRLQVPAEDARIKGP